MIWSILLSGFWSCGIANANPITKIGKHLDKIKAIEYKQSLKQIDELEAAEKIMPHVNAIKELSKKVTAGEPIKEYLTAFVITWDTVEKIRVSLIDERVRFMTDVTTFYMRGFVKDKKGSKTLFPIFKP